MLKLILEDLDLTQPADADKSDLLIAFKHFLIATSRQGKRVVIVIDEAQNLSREVLEEVRLLTNLGQGQEQPVQIILVGQPELEATIERQDLAQLRQRIRVHCRLAPLDRRELEEYVNHRMKVAGGAAGSFSGASLDGIFRKSGGVPRVVNTLCDRALLSAFVAGRKRVDVADLDDGAGAAAPDAAKHGQGEELPSGVAIRGRGTGAGHGSPQGVGGGSEAGASGSDGAHRPCWSPSAGGHARGCCVTGGPARGLEMAGMAQGSLRIAGSTSQRRATRSPNSGAGD
ncbi:MAG: AAA family ATPase [bacterium]|nr:AAA family ATPase [bacterium]